MISVHDRNAGTPAVKAPFKQTLQKAFPRKKEVQESARYQVKREEDQTANLW